MTNDHEEELETQTDEVTDDELDEVNGGILIGLNKPVVKKPFRANIDQGAVNEIPIPIPNKIPTPIP